MDVAVHFGGPFEEAPEVGALAPDELPELEEADLLHFDAAVGFDAPEQVGTAPGGEAVSASRVPEEAKDVPHGFKAV